MTLQTQAVGADLWALLQKLMLEPMLREFFLVGGTALALRYGHRLSVDIDLFTDQPFDASRLVERLTEGYGLLETSASGNSCSGAINGIKVDCMAHQYPMICGAQEVDGIRILAVEDIAAMKLNAIANRGCKKDFWDLRELSRHYSRAQLLEFYQQKYPQGSLWAVEKSLSYFDDAEAEPDPVCLKAYTWEQIKAQLVVWNRL